MPFSVQNCKHSNLAFTFLTCLILVSLFRCGTDREFESKQAEQNLAKGWEAYHQQSFAESLLNFERSIHLDPDLSDAYNGLGWSHLSILKTAEIPPPSLDLALMAFEQAIRSDKKNADAWIGLANTLFLRRKSAIDFESAILALDSGLTADSSRLYRHDYQSASDVYTLKVLCHLYLGQTDQARQWLEKAASVSTAVPALHFEELLVLLD